jgi:hypothetical protein
MAKKPAIDFDTAPLVCSAKLFKLYGSVRYKPHLRLNDWMTTPNVPDPFVGKATTIHT